MSLRINKELLVVGFLLYVLKEKEAKCKETGEEFFLNSINGTEIKPEFFYNYCIWLTNAYLKDDVVIGFRKKDLINLLNDKNLFFKKIIGDSYKINLDPSLEIGFSKDKSIVKNFTDVLIKKFDPNENYPKSFLIFLGYY